MGTNSLVLKISLKYYEEDHKTRAKTPNLKARTQTKKTLLTKQEVERGNAANEVSQAIKIHV